MSFRKRAADHGGAQDGDGEGARLESSPEPVRSVSQRSSFSQRVSLPARTLPSAEQETTLSVAAPYELSRKAEELAAVLDAHRRERHVIVVQSYPDPDAISSALAHQNQSQVMD